MQFIAIRIESNGKISNLYFEYGIYREQHWHCTLLGDNRRVICRFIHPQINSCFAMLSDYLLTLGRVVDVTALSGDIVFPEILCNHVFDVQHIDSANLAHAC